MKKIFFNFLIGFVLLCISPVISNASLIAYFPFEDNANDATGNGYDGSVSGATITTNGHSGKAYIFDGIDDYIYVPLDINPSKMPTLTMGAWVKADDSSPIKQIISHDNGGYDRSLGIDYRGSSSGWSAFSGTGEVLGGYPVTTGSWTFVAVVYDQNVQKVTLYVDGNTMSEIGYLGTGNTGLRIGSNPGFGEYFKGTIDDVFFYDEALSTAQLDDIRTNGISPVPLPSSFVLLFIPLGFYGLRRTNWFLNQSTEQ